MCQLILAIFRSSVNPVFLVSFLYYYKVMRDVTITTYIAVISIFFKLLHTPN